MQSAMVLSDENVKDNLTSAFCAIGTTMVCKLPFQFNITKEILNKCKAKSHGPFISNSSIQEQPLMSVVLLHYQHTAVTALVTVIP